MRQGGPRRTLDLVVTSRCNLRCAYCFENARAGRAMDWETARAALDSVLKPAPSAAEVVVFGGEPALEFPMLRRAVAHASARRGGRSLRFHLVTNGTLLGGDEVLFLAERDVETQISFDGVPEAQDLRGAGTFERLDSLLDAIRAAHPPFFRRRVSVAMTVTPATIPLLARSVAYFLEKRVREIRIAATMTPGPSWHDGLASELDRQFALVSKLSREHVRRTGRIPVDLLRKPLRRGRSRRGAVPMCGAASGARFGVDVDGSILPCGVFARSIQRLPATSIGAKLGALDLGNVRGTGLDDALAAVPARLADTGIFHDKQDKYASYGRCAECRDLRDCAICPASIVLAPGNDDPRRVPDFLCAFNRTWLKFRRRFPAVGPASRETCRRRRKLLAELASFAERARGRAPAPRS